MTNLQFLVFLAFLSTIFATVLSLRRKLMSVHDKIVLLSTKVDTLKTVVDGAVATLNTISEQIRETAGDEDAALALADSIDAETTALAAAIANVPPVVAPKP